MAVRDSSTTFVISIHGKGKEVWRVGWHEHYAEGTAKAGKIGKGKRNPFSQHHEAKGGGTFFYRGTHGYVPTDVHVCAQHEARQCLQLCKHLTLHQPITDLLGPVLLQKTVCRPHAAGCIDVHVAMMYLLCEP